MNTWLSSNNERQKCFSVCIRARSSFPKSMHAYFLQSKIRLVVTLESNPMRNGRGRSQAARSHCRMLAMPAITTSFIFSAHRAPRCIHHHNTAKVSPHLIYGRILEGSIPQPQQRRTAHCKSSRDVIRRNQVCILRFSGLNKMFKRSSFP